MAELMGICGAGADSVHSILCRMAANIDCSGGLRADCWEEPGDADASPSGRPKGGRLGLVRFHHGVINPQQQPIYNEDRTRLVAMDGEVFDTQATRRMLAAAGHRFRHADNDAELILHLYEQKGPAAFRELTGTFSVLIYEPAEQRLLLVTDRSFTRPIYYCRHGEALVFSSRFNALVAGGALGSGRLDVTALMTFLTYDDVHHTMTYYRQAQAMLPASILYFQRGRITTERYWRVRYSSAPGSEQDHVDRLAEALRRSARRMTSDGYRKGLMLSGGIDSRSLVAASQVPLRTYTTADFLNREARIARRIARTKGWRHVFMIRRGDHYARILDEAIELNGAMGRFDNCHFLGQLDRIRAECDVLFTEEPMDRMFKGYYWQRRWFIGGLRLPLPVSDRVAPADIDQHILRLPVKSTYRSRPWLLFREPWRSRYHEMMLASIRMQMADAETSNPYNLVEHVAGQLAPGRIGSFQNIACVRPYLEYRSFCFDSDLLEVCLQMPVRYRMGGGALKKAIRQLDPRLYAIPYANTGLRFDAPEPVAWAYHLGTEAYRLLKQRLRRLPRTHTNESWSDRAEVARTSTFRQILKDVLWDEACIAPDVFDTDWVRHVFTEHMDGRRSNVRLLMSLLTFGRWFKKYGPGSP